MADYQKALAGMPGIDLIPPQWLHLTMQGIGFTDQISATELGALSDALTAGLATVEQPAVHDRPPGSDLPQGPSCGSALPAAPGDA